MKSGARTFFPKNRIETLAQRPGGIPRGKAIEQAGAAVEELRDESIQGMRDGIESIEATIGTSVSGHLTAEQMLDILRLGDRIILLSGTFDFPVLSKVAMCLCDLVGRLIEIDHDDVQAVRVFVRALRFVAPPNSALGDKEANAMLQELYRILIHYGARSKT